MKHSIKFLMLISHLSIQSSQDQNLESKKAAKYNDPTQGCLDGKSDSKNKKIIYSVEKIDSKIVKVTYSDGSTKLIG